MPSLYRERVAATRTATAGEPRRELAERWRAPLFASGGVLSHLSLTEQHQLQASAAKLAGGLQRASANVDGRNG
jgi:hypothetical protein